MCPNGHTVDGGRVVMECLVWHSYMFMGIVNRICLYIDLGLLATLLRVLQRRIMNLPDAVRDFLPISPQIYEKKPMFPSRRELIFFFRFFSPFHDWHIVQMLSFVNLKMPEIVTSDFTSPQRQRRHMCVDSTPIACNISVYIYKFLQKQKAKKAN